jgi:hypothetical protein
VVCGAGEEAAKRGEAWEREILWRWNVVRRCKRKDTGGAGAMNVST